jgi:hypothetical protein
MGGRGRLGVLRASAEMDAVIATIGDASQNLVVQGNPVDAEFHVEQASSADQPLDSVG